MCKVQAQTGLFWRPTSGVAMRQWVAKQAPERCRQHRLVEQHKTYLNSFSFLQCLRACDVALAVGMSSLHPDARTLTGFKVF